MEAYKEKLHNSKTTIIAIILLCLASLYTVYVFDISLYKMGNHILTRLSKARAHILHPKVNYSIKFDILS